MQQTLWQNVKIPTAAEIVICFFVTFQMHRKPPSIVWKSTSPLKNLISLPLLTKWLSISKASIIKHWIYWIFSYEAIYQQWCKAADNHNSIWQNSTEVLNLGVENEGAVPKGNFYGTRRLIISLLVFSTQSISVYASSTAIYFLSSFRSLTIGRLWKRRAAVNHNQLLNNGNGGKSN